MNITKHVGMSGIPRIQISRGGGEPLRLALAQVLRERDLRPLLSQIFQSFIHSNGHRGSFPGPYIQYT